MNWTIIKIVGGIIGGFIPVAMAFHANMSEKIHVAEIRSKEYVQLKLEPFKHEIDNLKKDLGETKDMVKDIHKHLLEQKKNDN